MLLLTGPAGSGKTFRILEQFRAALARRDAGVRLLTPTATMAEHLRNQLAREGFVFRPALIQTLSRFVDSFVDNRPQVSEALLYLISEEAVRRVNRPEFTSVANMPGFCAALARSIGELSSAGCDAERLAGSLARAHGSAPLAEAFLAVYREVDQELRSRGLATRAQRLQYATERIETGGLPAIHTVWLDGFFVLPEPELAVIRAICRHADVTLALPTSEITADTERRLLAMGFVEETCSWQPAPPHIECCAAPSIERESDEIARRVLEQVSRGREFRDIGVIVRTPEIYEPVLRATFERFGIPARFYFDAEVSRHPLARSLTKIVDAMLGGWDYADVLTALRLMPGGVSDAFDFAVREAIPGKGIAGLSSLTEAPAALLEALQSMERWRTLSLAPADWAEELRVLPDLIALERPEPRNHESAVIARGRATALGLFVDAIAEAASARPPQPIRLAQFWRTAKSVLRLTALRVPDGRRNVLHVFGAHEARQWRLPVIFVCGLIERQFPKSHTPDPFLPDAARLQLNRAGIRLRTAADFEAEERFLFDCAMTRATEELTLSYPRLDARGQQNLPSLFLPRVDAPAGECEPVLPKPAWQSVAERPASVIASADLLTETAARHQRFKPTALESYLQCAFQFFGRHTLRLHKAPELPEERLDFLTQGSIVHEVLAALPRDSRMMERLFDEIFTRICAEKHVPRGYRTEARRERMLQDLHALISDALWTSAFDIRTEQKFDFQIADDVQIRGRIDRLEITTDGGAFVTDFKYSGAQNTKNLAASENVMQPQIYMLAVERFFGLRPEGMRYLGFKGGVRPTPWMPFAPEPAVQKILEIAAEIRSGRVEPMPANPDKCRFCELRDVCRFQVASSVAPAAEGASAWS